MVKNQRNAFIECIKRHDKHILHVCLAAQLQRQLNTALITRTSGPDRLEPSSHAQLYIRNNNSACQNATKVSNGVIWQSTTIFC